MGNVGHKVRALLVCDLAQACIVPVARVSGSTADQDSRLEQVGVLVESLVVDETSSVVDLIGQGLEVDG